MVYHFMGALRRLPFRTRRVLLIAVLVGAAFLLWTTAVFSQGRGGTLKFVDGMIGPDAFIVHVKPDGEKIRYEAAMQRRAGTTVTRNGKPWLTITYKDGAYLISDPTGTGEAVITASASKKPGY